MNVWPRSPSTRLLTLFPFTIVRPPNVSCDISHGLSHLDELDIFFCERCSFVLRQSLRNLHI